MNCSICNLPTGNTVGSVLPQCKCGWQAPNPPATQRPWVGLTDEDRREIFDATERDDRGYVAALVEAKLEEKNK